MKKMANNWTEEQKKVIELHNRNILVSAAAGSGKTAVLVERIIRMITRENDPVDIDRLVVVTFTNMAAYEMRMRIMAAIEKKIEEEPYNKHLSRQLTLVNNAKITTIDSFCLNIVKSYFGEADLDPAFRVADEGEIELLSSDVMKELLDDYYESKNEAFIDFVDSFSPNKTDGRIEDYIKKLYRFSQSYPWPKNWLLNCGNVYLSKDKDEFMQSSIMQYMMEDIKSTINSACEELKLAAELCLKENGPLKYYEVINGDIEALDAIRKRENYDDIKDILSVFAFGRLPAIRDKSISEELKSDVKGIRDRSKKCLESLKKYYFTADSDYMFSQVLKCRPHIEILVELTMEYAERMEVAKRKKKIINFSDMEHIALNILVKKEGDKLNYTSVADELAARYEEIMIDEYQDSNMVQEMILKSISKERFGKNNIFMVGDVKQSIYKFRLARPELFIEKYNTYSDEDSDCQKIELHKNFRSRESVLESVNEVFQKIMTASIGKIQYDENARLNAGMEFPASQAAPGRTRLRILEHKDEYEYNNVQAEAVLVADTIIELMSGKNGTKIYDKDNGEYRIPRADDIVILLRSNKGYADIYVEVLSDMGIPAYAESSEGYFGSREIQTVLSMLAVIDNPKQDIPLAAAMVSYFGNLSLDELSKGRIGNGEVSLYDAFKESEDEKCIKLMELITEYREYSRYMDVGRLCWKLIYETGFYDYVGKMPAGKKRQVNLNMLVEKARQYEATGYKGLFNFLRYIEKLKKNDIDFAGAADDNDNDGVVRIMSIHKSKGLEFPIVILAGMSKQFNTMDARESIILEPDFGIGMDMVDINRHIKKPTIIKKITSKKIVLDNLAEEQRILYVAMTRAKEQLIMTACVNDVKKNMADYSSEKYAQKADYNSIVTHKNYLDMVMPAFISEGSQSCNIEIIEDEAFQKMTEKHLDISADDNVYSPETEDTESKNEYAYPYDIPDIPVKMSVSEIKHMSMDIEDDEAVKLPVYEEEEYIPEFIRGEKKVMPAQRGSAYHELLQYLDYKRCDNFTQIKEQIDELVASGHMPQEWSDVIYINDIITFVRSSVGINAAIAAENNRLFREKQFMIGIPAHEIYKDIDSDELILVQGIIDMYYETDDGIVLVDYKTDHVEEGQAGEKVLLERYTKQLELYKMALEMILKKSVIKVQIYSFCLKKVIDVEV